MGRGRPAGVTGGPRGGEGKGRAGAGARAAGGRLGCSRGSRWASPSAPQGALLLPRVRKAVPPRRRGGAGRRKWWRARGMKRSLVLEALDFPFAVLETYTLVGFQRGTAALGKNAGIQEYGNCADLFLQCVLLADFNFKITPPSSFLSPALPNANPGRAVPLGAGRNSPGPGTWSEPAPLLPGRGVRRAGSRCCPRKCRWGSTSSEERNRAARRELLRVPRSLASCQAVEVTG